MCLRTATFLLSYIEWASFVASLSYHKYHQMRPEFDHVLQCLSLNGYSVLSLVTDILAHGSSQEDQRIKCLLEGVEQDAVDICTRLLNHNTTSASVSTWALGVALQLRARNEHSPNFMTSHPLRALSLPNGDVVPPSLTFGTTSMPADSSQDVLNIGKARCTCLSSGVVPPNKF